MQNLLYLLYTFADVENFSAAPNLTSITFWTWKIFISYP